MWVASDAWSSANGSVNATWLNWAGDVLNTTEYPFVLPGLASMQLDERQGWSAILPPNSEAFDAILLLNLTAQTEERDWYTHENFLVPKYLSHAQLINPGLTMKQVGPRTWRVEATRGVAAYVWLSHPIGVTGYFDDNAVFMRKGQSCDFVFTVLNDKTSGKWVENVRVRSLWDNYQMEA